MDLPIQINIADASGKNFQFNTLETLSSFIKTELKFWKEKSTKQSENGLYVHPFLNSYSDCLQSSLTTIENWKPSLDSWDTSTFTSELNRLSNNYLNSFSSKWLWSGHPYIEPWIRSYQLSQDTGNAFLEAVTKNTTGFIVNGYQWMQGYLLAYEFRLQDESQITKRRHAEKATFATIRNQLIEKKDELIKDVANYQTGITKWKDDTQNDIDDWHKNHITLVDETALKHSKEYQERLSAWTEKVTQLEALYIEKLRLDGPANYWNKSATKFRKQGFYLLFVLVLIAISAIVYFGNFFLAWLQGQSIGIKLQTLEGVLLFAIIISTFAFLIRVFSKLAFSSFHLQRDSEEREQLTHLYLSLVKDTTVDADSRNIILQALFSRSETGLLANESGPTMPTGIQDLISSATKK